MTTPDRLFGLALFLFALAVIAIILAVFTLISTSALRRQIREVKRDYQRQNTSLLALYGAMKVISEDVISHGQTQSSVRRTLERLAEQQSELRLREVDGGLYPQAIQLIHEGRSREEVRKLCALTESEVDLLFSLHGQGLGFGARSVASDRR
jgi:biopolymer transport protein ExbB/TolQ